MKNTLALMKKADESGCLLVEAISSNNADCSYHISRNIRGQWALRTSIGDLTTIATRIVPATTINALEWLILIEPITEEEFMLLEQSGYSLPDCKLEFIGSL